MRRINRMLVAGDCDNQERVDSILPTSYPLVIDPKLIRP